MERYFSAPDANASALVDGEFGSVEGNVANKPTELDSDDNSENVFHFHVRAIFVNRLSRDNWEFAFICT